MATAFRLPLAPCAPHQLSPLISRKSSGGAAVKRPRSPEPLAIQVTQDAVKRQKSQSHHAKDILELKEKEREKRRVEREAAKEEFRVKYSKAFPSWTFYFDTSDGERDALASRVVKLNGVRFLPMSKVL